MNKHSLLLQCSKKTIDEICEKVVSFNFMSTSYMLCILTLFYFSYNVQFSRRFANA